MLWFALELGTGRSPKDAAADLAAAGFTRVLEGDETVDLAPTGAGLPKKGRALVVVDRLVAGRVDSKRLTDSVDTAMRAGVGRMGVRLLGTAAVPSADRLWSDALHCPYCDRAFKDPTPNLFSFNSPLGACPTCHGFGRMVGIDWDLVVPVPSRSLKRGALAPLEMPSAAKTRAKLMAWCRAIGIPTDVPWAAMTEEHRRLVLRGDGEWERHGRVLRVPRVQGLQDLRARPAVALPRLSRVSRLRRRAPGRGGPRVARRGEDAARRQRDGGRRREARSSRASGRATTSDPRADG